MRPLRTGEETVLAWPTGALDCQVVAVAGSFVLLRPLNLVRTRESPPAGECSLTYLDGMIPMGWDGRVEPASVPGELRFRIDGDLMADRRSAVRLPVFAEIDVTAEGATRRCSLLDVSAGGARFRFPDRLVPGTLVELRGPLPADGPHLDAEAIVRGSEPGIAAVEFTELRATTAQEIGAWTVGRLRAALNGRG